MTEEIIDAEILWNELPEGDYVAKLSENETNILEHVLNVDEINEDEWETYIKVYYHPKNAWCIQGICVFRNSLTKEVIKTTESTVVENKNIEFIKSKLDDEFYIAEVKKLERI